MTNVASWVMGMVGPLAMRVLISVGFTAITFAGVQTVVNALVQHAQTAWATLPATALQLASLMGVPEGLGLIFAAVVARSTMWLAANSTRLIYTGRAS